MKRINLVILLLMLMTGFYSYGQKYYHAKTAGQIGQNPYYILPKASLLIEVPVITKTYTPSPNLPTDISPENLKILKEKYGLDLSVYVKVEKQTPYISHSVMNDSVKISILAKPDLDKIFYTEGQKKWNKDKSISFAYGTDGILTDGESSSKDMTFDIVVKGLSGLAQVAGAAFRGTEKSKVKDSLVTYNELDDILKELDKLRIVISDYDIYKDNKSMLEKRYASVFSTLFYSEKVKIEVIKIYYTPANLSINSDLTVKPFSFNSTNGVITLSQALSDQLWAKNLQFGSIDIGQTYTLKFSKPVEGVEKYIQSGPNSTGFAYNIPAKLEVKLTAPGEKNIFNDFMKIPQFGTIGRIISDKNKLSFSLDPLTGELRKLGLGSSAITVDQVGAGTTALTELIKYQDAKLDLEIKRLEAEKKKRDLLKELE
ncbi:MAG: hypothetical protein LBF27_28525 [Sphingobacterium sp.]|jgi:hypothetical protein|nr:hypothetical protein [Sphingobacterium sp.]